MKPYVKRKEASTENVVRDIYDYQEGRTVTTSKSIGYTVVGHYQPKSPHWRSSNGGASKVALSVTLDDTSIYRWGLTSGSYTWTPTRFTQVDGQWKTVHGKPREVYWTDGYSEQVRTYRNYNALSMFEYERMNRGYYNPKLDDKIVDIVEWDKNEDLHKWLTKCYIEMSPDLKEYFKKTMPHTPPMALMAIKHPGFRVLIAGGWVPTIPFSTARGPHNSLMKQPHPKRLIAYIYGASNKANFKHLRETMEKRNNWALPVFGRWGREFFPGEWIKDLAFTDETRYPDRNMDISQIPMYRVTHTFRNVKQKRVFELFSDAVRSVDNLELFFDTMRMGWTLGTAMGQHQPIDIWTEFNTRYIDEMHTRTTEAYNERYRNHRYNQYNFGAAQWTPDTDLKPDNKLLEIQDNIIAPNMTLRVAEKAAEVVDWGGELHHCIASYVPQAVKGSTTLLGIYKNKRLYANASVSSGKITQLRGLRNASIPAEDANIIKTAVERAFLSQGSSGKSDRIVVPV